jgi:Zn-finger protein
MGRLEGVYNEGDLLVCNLVVVGGVVVGAVNFKILCEFFPCRLPVDVIRAGLCLFAFSPFLPLKAVVVSWFRTSSGNCE